MMSLGMSMGQIAKELSLSTVTISRDYHRVLQHLSDIRREMGKLRFEEHLAKLDALYDKLQPFAGPENIDAVNALRNILKDQAELLDMIPKAGHGGTELNIAIVYNGMTMTAEQVAEVQRQAAAPLLTGGDVEEAEIVAVRPTITNWEISNHRPLLRWRSFLVNYQKWKQFRD